ncbi:hypothetical protein HKCCE3408_13475 [Rhodobacterales bacterium HKCCE3408]|nr:hypothetical protein [Rhodobacterales bacterium HKCCE3408]
MKYVGPELHADGTDVAMEPLEFGGDGSGVGVSSDSEWKYVNVTRYFIFVETAVDDGTEWPVFEDDDNLSYADLSSELHSRLEAADWTDHDTHDAGQTLLEIFRDLADMRVIDPSPVPDDGFFWG